MRVVIVEDMTYTRLEYQLNYILKHFDSNEILDIKYSGCGRYIPSQNRYSAMIILK